MMLMQCLLFVYPFGGVYKPKNKQNQIPQSLRSLHRISIFNPEVKYPKPAIPYQLLSDDLLHYFYQCFEQDQRSIFPLNLLTQFWIRSHFGFYRAEKLNICFIFDLNRSGMNDCVKLPNFSGKLIDSHCTFNQSLCWFFVTLEIQEKLINKVYVIQQNGEILAMIETQKSDQS